MTEQREYVPDYEKYDYEGQWRSRGIENEAEKSTVRAWLPTAGNCLELGGGYGRITSTIESRLKPVFMIDYSMSNLTKAERRLTRTRLIRADFRRIPFEDSSFDCVIAVRVLHHFENVRGILNEVERVARKGAVVILGVPNPRFGRYLRVPRKSGMLLGPMGHRSYIHQCNSYASSSLVETGRKGTGALDNKIGRSLSRFTKLSVFDTATSSAWKLKPELFIRFQVIKENALEHNPDPICKCGSALVERTCTGCGRSYDRIIDLVD